MADKNGLLTRISGQLNDPVQVIDTFPLPVCVLTRDRRDRCFPTEANFGYCAAKEMHYYGFKLGLRISRLWMMQFLPTRPRYSKYRCLAWWIPRHISSR